MFSGHQSLNLRECRQKVEKDFNYMLRLKLSFSLSSKDLHSSQTDLGTIELLEKSCGSIEQLLHI